jgi:acyl dehydratase
VHRLNGYNGLGDGRGSSRCGRVNLGERPNDQESRMRLFNGLDELRAAAGTHIGESEWITVEQGQIDLFADATGDHQWIHVDPESAKNGPFGTTIAHGFLTLSLLPPLVKNVYRVDGVKVTINYGLNRVRFTAPLLVGSKVRGSLDLLEVADAGAGVQVTHKVAVEIEGSERPALVAEWLTRHYV